MTDSLENEYLSVTLIPEEGGRIASLRSRQTGTEFLLQAQPGRPAIRPGLKASFEDGYCAGIEECLPSVSSSGEETAGGPVPDHGDLWQIAWRAEPSLNARSRCISATAFSRPLHVRKLVSLEGRSLVLNYTVKNTGTETTSFLYACHPLLAVDEGDRILLPDEVKELRLHSSRLDRLGRTGDILPWPDASIESPLALDRVLAKNSGTADMLYTSCLTQGGCGVYRARSQEGVALHFDTAQLPYLGLWLCYGGWPEGSPASPQYAVALEPTTAPCGTLLAAQQQGHAVWLAAGASLQWSIRFTLSEPGCDLARFAQTVSSSSAS